MAVGLGGTSTPFEMALSPTPIAIMAAPLDRSPRIPPKADKKDIYPVE